MACVAGDWPESAVGRVPDLFVVFVWFSRREPSIVRSTAHISPFVSRAWFFPAGLIQRGPLDLRSTAHVNVFLAGARAVAACAGPSDAASTAHVKPRRLGFIGFPET